MKPSRVLPLSNLRRGHGALPFQNLTSNENLSTRLPNQSPESIDQQEKHGSDYDRDNGYDSNDQHDSVDALIPNYKGFKVLVQRLYLDMDSRYDWLVNRIAHQQATRYKCLLDLKIKHARAIERRDCTAGSHCLALGGSATLSTLKSNSVIETDTTLVPGL